MNATYNNMFNVLIPLVRMEGEEKLIGIKTDAFHCHHNLNTGIIPSFMTVTVL